MNSDLQLPDYREQSAEVAERFNRIRKRPVVMEIENVDKIFRSQKKDIQVLKQINFRAHRREFISIIGPSGCGKSTLIRILAGLEDPSGGRILLDGKPISGPGPERGMVFQSYTLFPWLNVRRNVQFGLKMKNRADVVSYGEAGEWINLVGLSGFENHYPHQLSGGMKQRVAIARALANRPRVLLMDEPFGALDAQTRARMQAYLLQIWKNVDVTILFITHDLDEAVYLSDRILVLSANPGEVAEVIEVPVPRPRSTKQMLSGRFLAVKKRLEELIHPEHEEAPLPMMKLTAVGDEVM
jgi:NitT/TauT family transport system ATP-binding protein